ncbi:exodeoxyribonuclease VII large subunit [Erwinia sp. OLTSP20]|uniref:exodeoxyribonuclease VII large subunit n=1 Tax=unclassified Erwinia TaxID=2622719 RepID=UPI000C185ED1|nr:MULTISPECIES: exodeoxyribonuclease VII large subunit [unclassified Erwinia]PIJ52304.1 exodeoxyribonuclease VII large subunit [Erwinia sp. OAMSP11]PIJ73513.1 exodeoxyribonuclease VII large subunit [Erwinia sp. OLSSP12]PIJ85330.1 exodeoxyribonuclease VII large subunit [Erwinia sp. OLCASP19]PIJ87572.1 exodeoxyribonuclease VII large subunit [Erwinia sp. OLMTSP26]PIJ89079.1 exodeoxyribonuclease VII large subunit [Erwinia sp. OLMDSP33]
MSLPPSGTIFTVSRLNTTVRQLLEQEMGQVWLNAEISNFSQPASGHWYFTLKDDAAQVRCAMFRNSNRRVTFRPQHGQQVLVRATLTLYEPRGDYQLIIESMQPAGEGLLQQQFEQLKQRLGAEGLFNAEHKQRLPEPARRLGVITSASGAALHDILHILQRRDPSLPVIIYPTLVQGAAAPASIVAAIERANLRNECDVLILGRGGGSLEDLWSFNDERVARAIFASRLPLISAVGHETDVTIADFVADLRAPTPSAAAELVSRNQTDLLRQLQGQQQRLEMALDYYLARQRQHYTKLAHRLQHQHPQLRLARQQSTLLQLQRRLNDALQRQLRRATQQQERIAQRLNAQQPLPHISRLQQRLQQQYYQLSQAIGQQLGNRRQHFATLAGQLEGVSPLATLARGFSVTTTADDKVVKKVRQLKTGDTLKTRLDDGWVESQVTRLHRPAARKKPAG